MSHLLSRRSLLLAAAGLSGAAVACAQEKIGASDLVVSADGSARIDGKTFRCALGRGGVRRDKREGDGATPLGVWPLREVFYRADRVAKPETMLPVRALSRADGWCDAPDDPNYNRPVQLPYAASAEALWRKDHLYDLIVVVGYNDAPVVPGAGSAIFLHVARANYQPTVGCVAFAEGDLSTILSIVDRRSRVDIRA
jgi:L,D-peptidoglycan transpeptidase YkuD (ErfK/YbiS/YcfS/YnhG family)